MSLGLLSFVLVVFAAPISAILAIQLRESSKGVNGDGGRWLTAALVAALLTGWFIIRLVDQTV